MEGSKFETQRQQTQIQANKAIPDLYQVSAFKQTKQAMMRTQSLAMYWLGPALYKIILSCLKKYIQPKERRNKEKKHSLLPVNAHVCS